MEISRDWCNVKWNFAPLLCCVRVRVCGDDKRWGFYGIMQTATLQKDVSGNAYGTFWRLTTEEESSRERGERGFTVKHLIKFANSNGLFEIPVCNFAYETCLPGAFSCPLVFPPILSARCFLSLFHCGFSTSPSFFFFSCRRRFLP